MKALPCTILATLHNPCTSEDGSRKANALPCTILAHLMMARASSRPLGPNNICDATKADETDNDGIEPLLTLGKR